MTEDLPSDIMLEMSNSFFTLARRYKLTPEQGMKVARDILISHYAILINFKGHTPHKLLDSEYTKIKERLNLHLTIHEEQGFEIAKGVMQLKENEELK